MKLSQFNYHLPLQHIAQKPIQPRDSSKLMLINRKSQAISHHQFSQINQLLPPNSILVFNDTKVFPARLYGHKSSGGKFETLLLNQITPNTYSAISKPGLKPNQKLIFSPTLTAKVINKDQQGITILQFNLQNQQLNNHINQIGHTPIPPYINQSRLKEEKLRQVYQTTYAKHSGSAAAPTAGLHFTPNLMRKLARHHQITYTTLKVGLGTFKPPTQKQIDQQSLHQETYTLSQETTQIINQGIKNNQPIIAVGTTSTRVLESSVNQKGLLSPQQNSTKIFIYPPYKFKIITGIITNFHLPKSSLLMLVSAFSSRPNTKHKFTNFKSSFIGQAYQQAIQKQYRFYSFGDATLIL